MEKAFPFRVRRDTTQSKPTIVLEYDGVVEMPGRESRLIPLTLTAYAESAPSNNVSGRPLVRAILALRDL